MPLETRTMNSAPKKGLTSDPVSAAAAEAVASAFSSVFETLECRRLLSFSVPATVETDPMPNGGDASDDMAIWVHPTQPDRSVIIGTDGTTSQGGLGVYDLAGKQIQFLRLGDTNNVDVRDGFSLGGQRVSLVAASLADERAVALYTVDPSTRRLEEVGRFQTGLDRAYGLAMYRSAQSGRFYVFVNDSTGAVEQHELRAISDDAVSGTRVRRFDAGEAVEGMVADDALGRLYVSEEDYGNIWRYGAEPGAGTARTRVDSSSGGITPDVEGLAIYDAGNGQGYLIASSQGSHDFVIYERGGDNDLITRFNITGGVVDAVNDTDGIDVISTPLGSAFPHGLFAAQDGVNNGLNINFKLVPWEDIAAASDVPLIVAGQAPTPPTGPVPEPEPEPENPAPEPEPGNPEPAPTPSEPAGPITAVAETDPIESIYDSAIWVNSTDASGSRIFSVGATGLRSYDLEGSEVTVHSSDLYRNVDLIDGFGADGADVTLVAATHAETHSLHIFAYDAQSGELELIGKRHTSMPGTLYGVALYQSARSGKTYAFINSTAGRVHQYELTPRNGSEIGFELVRWFDAGSLTEGMVADDELGHLYVAEEDVGIWKYSAEPDGGRQRSLVDGVDDGHLVADVEGLAIYKGADGGGYLIASSQGSDDFVLYERGGDNDYVRRFSIDAGRIDGVQRASGIAVTSLSLGDTLDRGFFVSTDEHDDSGDRNFKLVDWNAIDPLPVV